MDSTRKFRITKRDFDNAVKRPWDGKKCLVAQAMRRTGITVSSNVQILFNVSGADEQRQTFDNNFKLPGDEKRSGALISLRKSLPITATYKPWL